MAKRPLQRGRVRVNPETGVRHPFFVFAGRLQRGRVRVNPETRPTVARPPERKGFNGAGSA